MIGTFIAYLPEAKWARMLLVRRPDQTAWAQVRQTRQSGRLIRCVNSRSPMDQERTTS